MKFPKKETDKTDETGAGKDYNPFESLVTDEFTISEEFLVETIDLISNDPSLRNISLFFCSFKEVWNKFNSNTKIFSKYRITKGENLIKLKDSNFEINSGGKMIRYKKAFMFYNYNFRSQDSIIV